MQDEGNHENGLPQTPIPEKSDGDDVSAMEQSTSATGTGTDADIDTIMVGSPSSHHPPSRLMITKMVLENFKSYAGTKEIGPFHKCFSAVVGPNGSGKSNVIDAMLFVFGKRAKKLRLNKVSELIHKSDAVKDNPPDYARVSVHFQEIIDTGDGDNDYRVVSDSETVVTRIAKKDNSSTYKLDGKNSTFKEVATYLNSKGIDLDNNRFLILQGEVELISMMPPKGKTENDEGLLEYLEDIIGSSKYVEATNQAAAKVDALTEIRQEKLNRVKAIEKEKDSLEGAKLEAEALLAKEREIRNKQSLLYQIHLMNVNKDYENLAATKENVTLNLDQERKAIAMYAQRLQEVEGTMTEQRKSHETTFNELKRAKEEFSAFERKDIKLREEIKHERAQEKKIMDRIKAEENKQTAAANKRDTAQSRIPELEQRIAELSRLKVEEDSKLEKIEEETMKATQLIRRQLEIKTQELAPLKQERAIKQAALETVETELGILVDATNRAKERLRTAKDELASIDSAKAAKIRKLEEAELQKQNAKLKLVNLEKEDSELQSGEEALERRHNELVNQIEDIRSILRTSEGNCRSKAVQGILNAAKKGCELGDVGVLGRLGDLATIPDKYDIAVSTACGGMLDNIVVQTTAGAQRCLEFLRKYNLGRASFIPLDKQKKGAHDHPVETPENAPRLFDLIVPSNFAVTPALFLAVGNTLVAPDMDTATRWAYEFPKRWRVVTLNGDLIETTGTMSGGGKTARSGGMRIANLRGKSHVDITQLDQESTVEKVEKEAEQVQNLLVECRKRRLEIRGEIRAVTKEIRSFDVAIPTLALEIEGFETTRKELTKLIPELELLSVHSPEDSERKRGLETRVENCRQELTRCMDIASKLESEVSKLQKDILEAGGSCLRNQRNLCENLISDLSATEQLLGASQMEAVSAEKTILKAKTAKTELDRKLSLCREQLNSKESEFKALEAGALEVMRAYEEVKTVEADKRGALEIASKEIEELKKSHSEVLCREIDILGQIDALEKQIQENRKKAKHFEKELSRLRGIDDEESDPEHALEDSNDAGTGLSSNEGDDSPTAQDTGETPYSVLEKYDINDIKQAIDNLEAEKNLLAKNANMGAIAEYKKKEADYFMRVAELDQVSEQRNAARKEHEELRRERLEMFMNGFGIITLKLKEMYQMITLGGDAELELVDSLDPFSEGIVFSVRPPKKSWKNISNLSGGEKTLSSLSLVFALHHYKPTPLYVMDEIDAALDFKNVSIVANYIKERTKNAQFVIISLRNNMFELADRLVGIYKTNNCTKSVTINPKSLACTQPQYPTLSDKSNAPSSMESSNKTTVQRNPLVVLSPI